MTIEHECLEWQLNELNQLELEPNEWETLSQSHDSLTHSAELLQTAEQMGENIDGDSGIQHQIYQCQKLLGSLQSIESRFTEGPSVLAGTGVELGEISANIRDVIGRSDIDPNELIARESRMDELVSMARKYRIEPEELPRELAEIDERLQNLQTTADLEALESAAARDFTECHEAAHALPAIHHQAADRLDEETTKHMQHSVMKGARSDIALLPPSPTAHGLEQVQFQVAVNKGNSSCLLNKATSGNELARISLALQMVAGQYTQVPILVFDEVNTGTGSGVAEMVGRALRALGKKYQVLTVTHLPRIAPCGENHWQVRKYSEGEQTVSEISVLDHHQRIEKIARTLGGEITIDTARSHVTELLYLTAA